MRPLAIEILFLFLSDLVGSVASTAATITTNRVAQLDVAVFRFENNLNYRFKSNCCLQSALCEAQCDLAFHLCLRRFDAEYVVENAALSPKLCELGFVNITKKDKEYKHGIDMGLRKSLAVTDRWPVSTCMLINLGAKLPLRHWTKKFLDVNNYYFDRLNIEWCKLFV